MSDLTLSNIRTLLKIAGTYLVASGKADDSTVEAAIGGIMALIGIALSFQTHKGKAGDAAAMLAIGITLAFTACKSPEHTAYVTIGSVGSSANAAIGAYSEYIKSHEVPADQIKTVRKAVEAYVAANETARKAVASLKSGAGSQADVDRAIDAAAASSADLISLVTILTAPK